MTTVPGPTRQATDAPDLNSGDRMTRAQFHRLYSQMPDHFKAELVEGIVYVASPLKIRHGKPHIALAALFGTYEAHTPGVETADNVAVLLGDESEPQPDLYMRILPEFGGQSRTSADDYIDGPPELIAEIAYAT